MEAPFASLGKMLESAASVWTLGSFLPLPALPVKQRSPMNGIAMPCLDCVRVSHHARVKIFKGLEVDRSVNFSDFGFRYKDAQPLLLYNFLIYESIICISK